MDSIKRLRTICQKEKFDNQPRWYTFHRKFSIYFAWLFIQLGLTPNQVTLLGIFVNVMGYGLMLYSDISFVIIGFVLVYLGHLFDKVDGEVARYTGKTSLVGVYLDELNHLIIFPFIFVIFGVKYYLLGGGWLYILLGILVSYLVVLIRVNHSMAYLIYAKKARNFSGLADGESEHERCDSFLMDVVGFVMFLKDHFTIIAIGFVIVLFKCEYLNVFLIGFALFYSLFLIFQIMSNLRTIEGDVERIHKEH